MPADDRQRSLYASIALSLARLPNDIRTQIQPLALFHGGAHLGVMGLVLELEGEAVERVAAALIAVE